MSKLGGVIAALGAVDELCSFTGLAYSEVGELLLQMESSSSFSSSSSSSSTSSTSSEASRLILLETELFSTLQYLFDIGAVIASRPYPLPLPPNSFVDIIPFTSETSVLSLESYINDETARLPPLRNFILPIGGRAASQLHVCRSVCRRVERDYLLYLNEGTSLSSSEVNIALGEGCLTELPSTPPASKTPTPSSCAAPSTIVRDDISRYLNRLSDFFFTASRVVNDVRRKKKKEEEHSSTSASSIITNEQDGGEVKLVRVETGGAKFKRMPMMEDDE